MAADFNEEEIPECGAVFTFGRTRFAENMNSKFWIKNDAIIAIACGDEHSAVVSSSGRLYTFGSNDWGQLGHGHSKVCSKPTFVKALKQEKVMLVACGRSHTLVATESGCLYSFGAGSEGQLGLDLIQNVNAPHRIDTVGKQQYKMLSCGTEHSAALTTNGCLYVWGSDSEGQLGLECDECRTPAVLDIGCKVKYVACGYYHTAIVSEDGKLYTCGEADGGKLGLPDQLDSCVRPRRVAAMKEKVCAVACGNSHTAVSTESGKVYMIGSGDCGQLGLGTSILNCDMLQLVNIMKQITTISCGENHTACITDTGHLLTCGNGKHGKLGHGDNNFHNTFTLTRVKRFVKFTVKQVACGGCHMLVIAVPNRQDESDSEESVAMSSGRWQDASELMGSKSVSPRQSLSARDRRRSQNAAQGPLFSLQPIGRASLQPLDSLNGLIDSSNSRSVDRHTVAKFEKPKLPDISVPSHFPHQVGIASVKPNADEDVPEVSEESGLSESENEEETERHDSNRTSRNETEQTIVQRLDVDDEDEGETEDEDEEEEEDEDDEDEDEEDDDDEDDDDEGNEDVKQTESPSAQGLSTTSDDHDGGGVESGKDDEEETSRQNRRDDDDDKGKRNETKNKSETTPSQSRFSKLKFWKRKRKDVQVQDDGQSSQQSQTSSNVCNIL